MYNVPSDSDIFTGSEYYQDMYNVPSDFHDIFTGREYYLNLYTKQSQWEPPTAPADAGPSKVQCSHLLVKHRESRRPASWRMDNITRTKEEALEILQGMIKNYVGYVSWICKISRYSKFLLIVSLYCTLTVYTNYFYYTLVIFSNFIIIII